MCVLACNRLFLVWVSGKGEGEGGGRNDIDIFLGSKSETAIGVDIRYPAEYLGEIRISNINLQLN